MLKSESIKSDPLKEGDRYYESYWWPWSFKAMFFIYVGLDSNFGSPLLAFWELGLQMWAIKDYSRYQYFAQSFPDVSGIIIKVDRDWSGFYIFESVYMLVSSTSLFCPNFSEDFRYEFLAMILFQLTIWIIFFLSVKNGYK